MCTGCGEVMRKNGMKRGTQMWRCGCVPGIGDYLAVRAWRMRQRNAANISRRNRLVRIWAGRTPDERRALTAAARAAKEAKA